MGVALGWIALALAGVAAAPRTERADVEIGYTVRFVETEGLGWRAAVFTRLTPVTRQGAATVWTAPRSVAQQLVDTALKDRTANVLRAPRVTARSGSPAHVSARANQQLITQVAWHGEDHPAQAKPETVRTGSVATMAGRKLDQGILIQLVLEDTEIRAIHRMNLPCAASLNCSRECRSPASPTAVAAQPQVFVGQGKAAGLTAYAYARSVCSNANQARCCAAEGKESTMCCQSKAAEEASASTKATGSSGCVCAKDEVVQACVDSPCCASSAKTATCMKDQAAGTIALEVPEIGSQEIAGEWLIPKEGILLVSFGPHTVAGKDGKPVIHERLAIIEAEEAVPASVSGVINEGIHPGPIRGATPLAAPRAATDAVRSTIPAPMAGPPIAIPTIPSRSIPQGFHSDGRPADLPPLPPEEAGDAPDESSEARPSPQTRKSQQPKPKPAADSGTTKAEYTLPRFPASLPGLFLSTPSVGLQFLIPLKPLSLRLPFNRRLEIEIFGRVVRNPEPVGKVDE